MSLAVIGGTGLNALPGLEIKRSHAVDTPYGATSAPIEEGYYGASTVFFLHRHGGHERAMPPHLVNYRANLWALAELGVTQVVAVNAVGAIRSDLRAGELVIPHQLIDYTWGREHTYGDGRDGNLLHVDFSEPYDAGLREVLTDAAARADVPCRSGSVVAVVQGPRLETAAEVDRLERDGCDLVGMTGMPEASLARELKLPYASICMIVNAAAGRSSGPITMEEIRKTLEHEVALVARLLQALLGAG